MVPPSQLPLTTLWLFLSAGPDDARRAYDSGNQKSPTLRCASGWFRADMGPTHFFLFSISPNAWHRFLCHPLQGRGVGVIVFSCYVLIMPRPIALAWGHLPTSNSFPWKHDFSPDYECILSSYIQTFGECYAFTMAQLKHGQSSSSWPIVPHMKQNLLNFS